MSEISKTESYDDKIVRNFAWATVLWGIVGMLVGVIIAAELFHPQISDPAKELSFGRIRPLHTNAVIFAFVGNGIFMGVYYSLQRLCRRRMFSDMLSKLHFWGWQAIIVAAAVTLPLGLSSAKEYAELEWPIDIAITVIWVVFGVNMIMTIIKRRESHMYVAIWFYLATFITVALLHVVNSMALPADFFKSYSMYAGVQDALIQWWYGHNAVAFFLTTPYLGLMYYFIPKASNRPVFSYRLSIIHFWSLIFIYIWAGPHHLLHTSLPDWCQTLGVVFSLMLIAPSWGGMLNGLLTLRGAWDKVRTEPVLKFMVVAITAYGMATFEGPLLSLRSLNSLTHYTDWTVAHVHVGGLGWNGYLTFGILYWIIPKLYKRELYSLKLANLHFWIGLIGIILYAIPLYWAGVTQGIMWQQFNDNGTLTYGNFVETVDKIIPMYKLRALGGLLYLVGAIIMAWNLFKTAAGAKVEDESFQVVEKEHKEEKKLKGLIYSHRWLEGKTVLFSALTLVAVLIGGLFEIVPMYMVSSNVKKIDSVKPYTPLEQYGRDIYVREGCYTCHSQMIRPFRAETERYGDFSRSGEFIYDRPFQWGSKRIGPDLARVGKRNLSNAWHYEHLMNPRSTSPTSIMPAYAFMKDAKVDQGFLERGIKTLTKLGVPYGKDYEKQAYADAMVQAEGIQKDLRDNGVEIDKEAEVIALIAYLQRLGTDYNPETEGKEVAETETQGEAK